MRLWLLFYIIDFGIKGEYSIGGIFQSRIFLSHEVEGKDFEESGRLGLQIAGSSRVVALLDHVLKRISRRLKRIV